MSDHPAAVVCGFSPVPALPPLMDIHRLVMKHGQSTAIAQETEGPTEIISRMLLILWDGTAI
jgi:hypothetical protein